MNFQRLLRIGSRVELSGTTLRLFQPKEDVTASKPVRCIRPNFSVPFPEGSLKIVRLSHRFGRSLFPLLLGNMGRAVFPHGNHIFMDPVPVPYEVCVGESESSLLLLSEMSSIVPISEDGAPICRAIDRARTQPRDRPSNEASNRRTD